jgi:hypothetical protein
MITSVSVVTVDNAAVLWAVNYSCMSILGTYIHTFMKVCKQSL